jgi:hypothetical protein
MIKGLTIITGVGIIYGAFITTHTRRFESDLKIVTALLNLDGTKLL